MIYQVAAILSVLALASANVLPREQYEKHFFEWMKTHEIKFANGAEFVQRLQVFADNFDYIEESNAKNLSYKLGLNAYSHLTTEEFSDYFHIGAVRPGSLRRSPETPYFEVPESTANPASVDWTTKGAVTGVKNQGNCGSCWSFSATGALEGIYKIQKGSLQSFSEQQLVSCDKVDKACNGGWMDDAFDWIKGNGGLCTESAYPYTSGSTGQTGTCYTSCSNVAGSKVSGYTDVKPGSVTSLEAAVAQQPVSIAIQANQKDFQSYKSGVLTGKCGQRLDHGVLLVGYGTDNGTPFWKVKNSWGTSWGEAGYIRILKDNSDLCGVLDAPSYPKL